MRHARTAFTRGLAVFVTCSLVAAGSIAVHAQADQDLTDQLPDEGDITVNKGPDMRFGTLEDVYGDSGSSFQGAIGFYNVQGTPAQAVPANGYGLGLDDMVVQWKEFQPRKDTTSCTPGADVSGGSCAAIEIDTSNLYEGGVALGVSIVE